MTTNAAAPELSRAEKFSSEKLLQQVLNGQIELHWINGEDRFWFKKQNDSGHEFVIVDAATGKQQQAFDHCAMTRALSSAGAGQVQANALPIKDLKFLADSIEVQATTKPAQSLNLRGGVPN